MALLRAPTRHALKDPGHLDERQILRPSNFDDLISRCRMLERNERELRDVTDRDKIDRISATTENGRPPLVHDRLADQCGPELHERGGSKHRVAEATGTQILFDPELDSKEVHGMTRASIVNGCEHQVLNVRRLAGVNEVAIAGIVYAAGSVATLAHEGMGCCDHLVNTPARVNERRPIPQVCPDGFRT